MDIYKYQFNYSPSIKKEQEPKSFSPVKNTNKTTIIGSSYLLFIIFFIILISLNYNYNTKHTMQFYKNKLDFILSNTNKISQKSEWVDYTHYRNSYLEDKFYEEPKIKHDINVIFYDLNSKVSLTYLIRNALLKLMGNCMITVICNKDNYDNTKFICDSLTENINIITNNTNNIYNLDTIKQLDGNYLLFHDMNSCLLNTDFKPFTNYDFIGVEGFNLIKKFSLLPILRKHEIKNYDELQTSIKNSNFKLAEDDISSKFIIDNIYNKEMMGCHQFWENDIYFNDLN